MQQALRMLSAGITLCLCILFAACSPRAVHAQIPTFTSPQSVQAVVAPVGTACTGLTQNFTTAQGIPKFGNLGQTQHYAYIKATSVTALTMQIYGLDDNGNSTLISDTATVSSNTVGPIPILKGSGAFSNIEIQVTCLPATTGSFFLSYSGTSATADEDIGSYLITKIDKSISISAPAGASYNAFFPAPYGTSLGTLYFSYLGAGPAGSFLQVQCQTGNGLGTGMTFNLVTTTAITQAFNVPPLPCVNVTATFFSGGSSTALYTWDYVFTPLGSSIPNSYAHITGTTATELKAGPGVIHSLVVGTPAAGTISLFDLPGTTTCTGTPSTNVISVITVTSTFPSAPEIYDLLFQSGLCVKASAGMDFTVSYQ